MRRVFDLSSGFDLSIRLEIDTEVLTPEFAHEIARFWTNKDEVLEASDGDDYQAVARLAAPWLWGYLFEDFTLPGAVKELHEQEGWCIPGDSLGIRILDHDLPPMGAAYIDATEVTA